ncbi:hypothetical protein AAFF_G00033490 [Aldrovandia affinis]|uniref:Uncharacterized protein n=1 Tax=Aldrovandia affinis TaxID=143900 RepID=A0AAD7S3L7_9TELE|nr:hypothetical protein AAFF_G00033490 [Aldrovandia affinis]
MQGLGGRWKEAARGSPPPGCAVALQQSTGLCGQKAQGLRTISVGCGVPCSNRHSPSQTAGTEMLKLQTSTRGPPALALRADNPFFIMN